MVQEPLPRAGLRAVVGGRRCCAPRRPRPPDVRQEVAARGHGSRAAAESTHQPAIATLTHTSQESRPRQGPSGGSPSPPPDQRQHHPAYALTWSGGGLTRSRARSCTGLPEVRHHRQRRQTARRETVGRPVPVRRVVVRAAQRNQVRIALSPGELPGRGERAGVVDMVQIEAAGTAHQAARVRVPTVPAVAGGEPLRGLEIRQPPALRRRHRGHGNGTALPEDSSASDRLWPSVQAISAR